MTAPRPRITEQQAVDLAKRVAEERHWAWVEPVQASWHPAWFGKGGRWEIFSNARGLGAKVRVVIDGRTGMVLEKGYIPR